MNGPNFKPVNLDKDIHYALKKMALEEDSSVAKIIRTFMAQELLKRGYIDCLPRNIDKQFLKKDAVDAA